ncbi:MAG: hypothetical protein JWQ01_2317 [Massilia sp.]|nr:hypothetical protein [Massilia sp.]
MVNRIRISLLVALFVSVTAAAAAETLETPSFLITIEVRCAEGNVTCDDVRYLGTSKKTGKSITLRGRTMHSKCADGVTPCQFQGYVFTSGRSSYTVTQGGELIVMQGEKTLVQEKGTWAISAAHAEPCVKVRSGDERESCMKFSAEERKKAAALGLQLGTPYAKVKQHLAKNGWSVDQKWIDANLMPAPIKNDLVCGSGWDAVCSTAFRKNRQTVSLLLSGTNEGTPLIGVEVESAP